MGALSVLVSVHVKVPHDVRVSAEQVCLASVTDVALWTFKFV